MGDSKLPAKIILQVLDSSLDAVPYFDVDILEKGRSIVAGLPADRRPGIAIFHGLHEGQQLEIRVAAQDLVAQRREVVLQPADNQLKFSLGAPGMSYYRQAGVLIPFAPADARHLVLQGAEAPPDGAQLGQELAKMIARDERLEARIPEDGAGIRLGEARGPGPSPRGSGMVAAELSVRGELPERKAAIGRIQRHLLAKPREGRLVVRIHERSGAYFTGEVNVAFRRMPSPDEMAAFEARFELAEVSRNGARVTFATLAPDVDFPQQIAAIEAEREWVIYAEPWIEAPAERTTRIEPSDFLFKEQWDFEILQMPEAWFALGGAGANLQFGNSRLIIGVADIDGPQVAHPDLAGMVNGLVKSAGSFHFGTNSAAYVNPLSHGTNCASAAAAAANRVSAVNGDYREGVAGAAPACRLISTQVDALYPQTIRNIRWLAGMSSIPAGPPARLAEPADVSSNSYRAMALSLPIEVEEAFQLATDFGRSGRGLAVFFSAANDGTGVSGAQVYAASKRVMTIGASTLGDGGQREVHASYSCFGEEVLVCAPSNNQPAPPALLAPPNQWGAVTATVTPAVAGANANGNMPGAPRRHGMPAATLEQFLTTDTPAGATTLTTTANTAPFAGATAVMVGRPGSVGAEGLQLRNIGPGSNQLGVRYSVAFPTTKSFHGLASPIVAGTADYRSDFGGTSYSTPIVAGIAALILSARPTLSWVEVREILRTTSRKINIGDTDGFGLWTDPDADPPNHVVLNADRDGLRPKSPAVSTTLAAAASAPNSARKHLNHGQSTLRLASAAGFEIGDAIHITNGVESDFHVIEDKAGDLITIDALRHDFGTSPTTRVTAGGVKPVRSDYYGYGRVNARRAVRAALAYSHADRDLAIRNHLADDGLADVDPALTPIHSPDIWLRNQDDPVSPAPPYDQPGPHQNPSAFSERYIYARIKNIGRRFANLDAWVHFYVALSDELPPPVDAAVNPAPGIATPFLFPGDPGNANAAIAQKSWCDATANEIGIGTGIGTGAPNVYHVRDAPSPAPNFNVLIPAGSVQASGADDVNSGVKVVRVHWDLVDVPPTIDHPVYLLVYVSPVDGERQGREAGRHNNMSYREIAFADFALTDPLDPSGTAPLPSSVQVDAFGTSVTVAFRLRVHLALGLITAERVQLELRRTSDNGSTETAFFRFAAGSWRLVDQGGAAVGWANLGAPIDPSTMAPVAGRTSDLQFDGDFTCAMQHQKISFRAVVHSARPGAVLVPIAEQSFEVQVVADPPPTPGASALHPDPPHPDSFAFTDFALLQPQPADKSFGPIDAGRFRITSVFRASSAPKAYAVALGVVMVQQVDADRVNLVLRPLRQPGLGMTPVKYYVYRGLRLDHFLDPADPSKVRPQAGAPDFVRRLWPIHVGQNPPGSAFSATALGCDPANQPATGHIDQFFFAAGGTTQYAIAKAGEWLGDFFHTGSSEFGFEIVLEEGTAQLTFQNVRQEQYAVDVSALPATSDTERLAKRLAREEILNYLDPAAFYGMHTEGVVRRVGGLSWTGAEIAANVVDKFATRHQVYLDIRNENGNSYNFYGNYHGASGPDLPRNLRLGTSESSLAAAAYGTEEWPLHIFGHPFATTGPFNPLALALRVNDNSKPVLYVEHGDIRSATVNRRFVDETQLLPGTANPPWTQPMLFRVPNTGTGSPRPSIAWIFKLHYGRQIDPATVFPPGVVPTVKTLDNLFGPLDLAPLWSGGQAVRWIAAQDRKFVDGQTEGFAQMMERGVAFEGAPPSGRVIFFAALTDELRGVIPGFRPLRGITGGTSSQGSFLQAAAVFDQYRLDFGSITDLSAKVTTLRLLPGSFSEPTLSSGVLFLGLDAAELARLQALGGLNDAYPRTVFFEELPGPFTGFRKFRLGVQGLQPDGKSGKVMAAAGQEVFAYTTNGRHFYSAAFSAGEPLPTSYRRNAEESVGQMNLDLPAASSFAIFSAAPGNDGRFDVARDLRQLIARGGSFQITGGGNDGTYKLAGIHYFAASGITTLTVAGNVPEPAISGSLQILPRKIEEHFLDLEHPLPIAGHHPLKSLVEAFRVSVDAIPNEPGAPAALEVQTRAFGAQVLERARAAVRDFGHAEADDRPLYWARIRMQVILKGHEFLVQHPEQAARLSRLLEACSRGLEPAPDFTPAGPQKRVLLIGFDPFLLRPGAPNNNSHFSNPSAVAALYLHANPGIVPDTFIQSVILPVRFEDFDAGLVDRLLDPCLAGPNRADLILTLGQGKDLGIHVGRFATRFRSPTEADNLNVLGQQAVHYELDVTGTALQPLAGPPSLSAILPRYFETTLPVARLVPGSPMAIGASGTQAAKTVTFDQRFRLAGEAALRGADSPQPAFSAIVPPPDTEVEAGSAGDFLANELFYRLAWRRHQRASPVRIGHLQLPKLQGAAGKSHALFDGARVQYFLDTVVRLLQDARLGL